MTNSDPIEFTRTVPVDHQQRAGNRVQLEDENAAPYNAANPVPVEVQTVLPSSWEVAYVDDEALNDSDKTIAVTAGAIWHILAIRVEFVSDANAGARQLAIEFQDGAGDVQWEVRPDLTQAATLTYLYNFGSSMSDMNAVRDTTWVSTPIPPTMILPENSQIRIYDNNAVSAAGDDMIVHLTIAERAA
jgi:hypothetical protein